MERRNVTGLVMDDKHNCHGLVEISHLLLMQGDIFALVWYHLVQHWCDYIDICIPCKSHIAIVYSGSRMPS